MNYDVSILTINDNQVDSLDQYISFLLEEGVEYIILRSSIINYDSIEIYSNRISIYDDFRVCLQDKAKEASFIHDNLGVYESFFVDINAEAVSSFPKNILSNGLLVYHPILKVAERIDSNISKRLTTYQKDRIKITYFTCESDITISEPSDILDYRFSRIIIITDLGRENSYFAPIKSNCRYHGLSQTADMKSSILMANMLTTVLQLTDEEWIYY